MLENRPLNASDNSIAAKGKYYFCFGFNYYSYKDSTKELDPVAVFEYGAGDNFDFEISLPYIGLYSSPAIAQGLSDVTIGSSIILCKESDALPAINLGLIAKLASADPNNGLGSGTTDYNMEWMLGKKINDVNYIINVGYILSNGGVSLSTGYFNAAFKRPVNDKFDVVGEFNYTTNKLYEILGGFIYKYSDTLAFDFGLNTGFTENSPAYKITSGLSYNF